MLDIKHYTNYTNYTNFINSIDIEHGINICLTYKLYIEGWSFQKWLKSSSLTSIVVAFHNNKALGCCLLLGNAIYPYWNFGVFVKESERRKGIGRKMIEKIQELYPNTELRTGCGINGSVDFFHNCIK